MSVRRRVDKLADARPCPACGGTGVAAAVPGVERPVVPDGPSARERLYAAVAEIRARRQLLDSVVRPPPSNGHRPEEEPT